MNSPACVRPATSFGASTVIACTLCVPRTRNRLRRNVREPWKVLRSPRDPARPPCSHVPPRGRRARLRLAEAHEPVRRDLAVRPGRRFRVRSVVAVRTVVRNFCNRRGAVVAGRNREVGSRPRAVVGHWLLSGDGFGLLQYGGSDLRLAKSLILFLKSAVPVLSDGGLSF